jgi:hypothetical protein
MTRNPIRQPAQLRSWLRDRLSSQPAVRMRSGGDRARWNVVREPGSAMGAGKSITDKPSLVGVTRTPKSWLMVVRHTGAGLTAGSWHSLAIYQIRSTVTRRPCDTADRSLWTPTFRLSSFLLPRSRQSRQSGLARAAVAGLLAIVALSRDTSATAAPRQRDGSATTMCRTGCRDRPRRSVCRPASPTARLGPPQRPRSPALQFGCVPTPGRYRW